LNYFQLLHEAFPGETEQMDVDQHQENQDEEKKKRRQLAQERKAKIMAKMNNMQKDFLKSHKQFFVVEMEIG